MNPIKKMLKILMNRRSYRYIKKLNAAGNAVNVDASVTDATVLEGKNRVFNAVIDDTDMI